MKKLVSLVVVLVLVSSVALATTVSFDFSGLSLAQLVEVQQQLTMAMWATEEWQEVEVPQGIWVVGEDIPAGTWTVKCADVGRDSYMMKECDLSWGESLSDNGQSIKWQGRHDFANIYNPNSEHYDEGEATEYTFTVQDGDYIIIESAYNRAVFTPYAGKPILGFK